MSTDSVLSPKKYAIARLVAYIKLVVSIIILFIPSLIERLKLGDVVLFSHSVSPFLEILDIFKDFKRPIVFFVLSFTIIRLSLCFGRMSAKKQSENKFTQEGKNMEYARFLYSELPLFFSLIHSVVWSAILGGTVLFTYDAYIECEKNFEVFFNYVNVIPIVVIIVSYLIVFSIVSRIWQNDYLVVSKGERLKNNFLPSFETDLQAIGYLFGGEELDFFQFKNAKGAKQEKKELGKKEKEQPTDDLDMLYRYKKLLDDGIITEEEYQEKKKEIMDLKK
ncbi:MAG: hypothetical protein E7637_04390 [Ruminococcaceae bacterium]|nr:hypothetical protein [Oscillospiraceae bacterium]